MRSESPPNACILFPSNVTRRSLIADLVSVSDFGVAAKLKNAQLNVKGQNRKFGINYTNKDADFRGLNCCGDFVTCGDSFLDPSS